MEDLWEDLSLPAAAAGGNRTVFQGLSLHDFVLLERGPTAFVSGATKPAVLRLNPERPAALLPPPNGCSDQSKPKRARREDGEDSRFKRMVKNRESAARSRARRQAYTYELELEIAHLQKENAKLKKLLQNKDLCLAKEAPAVEVLRKPSLHRTLTAPF